MRVRDVHSRRCLTLFNKEINSNLSMHKLYGSKFFICETLCLVKTLKARSGKLVFVIGAFFAIEKSHAISER